MAELHLVGTLHGAHGFPSANLACRWHFTAGPAWTLIEGHSEAQTHVDLPADERFTVWAHPIDVHYASKSVQGWPKLVVEVFHHDLFGRQELCTQLFFSLGRVTHARADGHGFVDIPAVPGTHLLECVTWQVLGDRYAQLQAYFLGVATGLRHRELVHTAADRFKLRTRPAGKVLLEISVMTHGFEQHGVAVV